MKKVKRMMAVLLAALMTLAMATTDFAAEEPKGSQTVRVTQNHTFEGQYITVWKRNYLTYRGDN